MSKPFKSGPYTLGKEYDRWALRKQGEGERVSVEPQDLAKVHRLFASALAYRHRGKARHA